MLGKAILHLFLSVLRYVVCYDRFKVEIILSEGSLACVIVFSAHTAVLPDISYAFARNSVV